MDCYGVFPDSFSILFFYFWKLYLLILFFLYWADWEFSFVNFFSLKHCWLLQCFSSWFFFFFYDFLRSHPNAPWITTVIHSAFLSLFFTFFFFAIFHLFFQLSFFFRLFFLFFQNYFPFFYNFPFFSFLFIYFFFFQNYLCWFYFLNIELVKNFAL